MPNKWTREEQKQLIVELKNGVALEEIAKKHERTVTAVEVRIQKIVYDAIKNKGTSFDKLAEITGQTKRKLLEYYKEYQQFMDSNKIIPKIENIQEQQKGGSHNSDKSDMSRVKKLEKLTYKLSVENKILKKVIKNMTKKKYFNLIFSSWFSIS